MIFKANAHWHPGSRGTVEGDPAVQALEFSAPPEFGGESGVWSPEHFLLAAVASCFVTTFKAIAELSKFSPVSLTLNVEGVVEKGDGGYVFNHVTLLPELIVGKDGDCERGKRLLEKAEHSCLISRSLKATVTMQAKVGVFAGEIAA